MIVMEKVAQVTNFNFDELSETGIIEFLNYATYKIQSIEKENEKVKKMNNRFKSSPKR